MTSDRASRHTSTLQASFHRYHRAFSLVRPVALVITHRALYATHRTSASALFGALVTRGEEALWKRDKCAFATLRSCFSLATFLFNSSTSAGVAAESEGRLPLRPPSRAPGAAGPRGETGLAVMSNIACRGARGSLGSGEAPKIAVVKYEVASPTTDDLAACNCSTSDRENWRTEVSTGRMASLVASDASRYLSTTCSAHRRGLASTICAARGGFDCYVHNACSIGPCVCHRHGPSGQVHADLFDVPWDCG